MNIFEPQTAEQTHDPDHLEAIKRKAYAKYGQKWGMTPNEVNEYIEHAHALSSVPQGDPSEETHRQWMLDKFGEKSPGDPKGKNKFLKKQYQNVPDIADFAGDDFWKLSDEQKEYKKAHGDYWYPAAQTADDKKDVGGPVVDVNLKKGLSGSRNKELRAGDDSQDEMTPEQRAEWNKTHPSDSPTPVVAPMDVAKGATKAPRKIGKSFSGEPSPMSLGSTGKGIFTPPEEQGEPAGLDDEGGEPQGKPVAAKTPAVAALTQKQPALPAMPMPEAPGSPLLDKINSPEYKKAVLDKYKKQ